MDSALVSLVFIGFLAAMILGALALICLTINYKNSSDLIHKDLAAIVAKAQINNWDEIKQDLDRRVDGFLKSSDAGWQHGTIAFGACSFLVFFFTLGYLIYLTHS